MATTAKQLSISSSSSIYSSNKTSNSNDFHQNFLSIVEKLKKSHENTIEILNKRILELESENKYLHTLREQHPHSIFDINYMSNDSSTVTQLRSELEQAEKQIEVLQAKVNEQFTDYQDMKSKYSLQLILNGKNSEQPTSTINSDKVQELESKLQQIKDQINQFDQCNYETDEQIRLLKQILTTNDYEQNKTITQSLTIKQPDLLQQTDIVESLLNKQHEKMMEKLVELLDKNPQHEQPVITKNKKPKKKRL